MLPPPGSIFVVKPSSLGDVVHTLPAVALIKKRWPQSRIRWLINPEWAPLLAGNPDIDEVVIFPRASFRGFRGLKKIIPWARAIRAAHRSDLVLDFQGLLRSALIGRLCRAAHGRLIGLSDAREGARFFYNETADVRGETHAVDRYLKLAALVRCDPSIDSTSATIESDHAALQWPLPPGTAPKAAPALGYILLHPFSRGAGKSLSSKEVSAFCQAMAPMRVVVAGRSKETVAPSAHVTDLLNSTSLEELIWLIRNAAFTVSVDSGPMHIAAAITGRLVSIHTWSDPQKVGPYHPDAWIWKAGQLFQRKNPGAAKIVPDLATLAAFVKEEALSEKILKHRA